MTDPYRILGLAADASDEQIKAAYRQLAKGMHPDAGGDADTFMRMQTACDLLLDTFPYGGHTLTSDALWAGTPVVTRSGDSFASRVAGSLLRAVGLEQLVARSAEEYRHIAETLLRDRPRREAIRGTLTTQRHQLALFDSAAYARKLEAALLGVVAARWQQG